MEIYHLAYLKLDCTKQLWFCGPLSMEKHKTQSESSSIMPFLGVVSPLERLCRTLAHFLQSAAFSLPQVETCPLAHRHTGASRQSTHLPEACCGFLLPLGFHRN